MNAMKTFLKFTCVIIFGFLAHFVLEDITTAVLDAVAFLTPFGLIRSVAYALVLIPSLALRAISDPAGKLAYIPAIIVPAFFPFLLIFFSQDMGLFSTEPERWSINISVLVESLVGIFINVFFVKFGGTFIYSRR